MRVSLVAGFFYFLLVGTAGVCFGVLREMFLTPSLGRALAVVVELPFMLAISWFSCRLLVRWNAVPENVLPRLVMGGTAFALLMGMEQALALAMRTFIVTPSGPQALTLADYIGFAGQVAFALFPLFVTSDSPQETS